MNKPEFFITPGYGERNLKLFHYSQAVKIGNRVEIAGQGGLGVAKRRTADEKGS